jgi:hypothetical protein
MKNIATALVKAQKAFGPALKTHTNPAFKSKYADLSACIEAVMDALNDNGIAMVQQTREDATGVTVETVFVHESGETLSSGPLHVPAAKQDPQGYGSALTYARRYSLMAACGIAPEDDDGNAASRRPEPVRMPENTLADWLDYINTASSVGELKSRLAEAEQAAAADPVALAKIQAAAAAKAAKAKPKALASQA